MQDETIISLYFKRAEEAITATKDKYGRLLVSIAYGILKNMEDAKECENDTYLKTWMSIPSQKPAFLGHF
jgi:ECF subfamily RNA polymerase sigma-24 factor